MNEKIQQLSRIIKHSDNIVFFGGAGVSTESNIPDFRSEKGLYVAKKKYGYSPEKILSNTFFKNHTNIFFEYYKQNMLYLDAKPNVAHYALEKLEDMGKLKAIITQNIDGLHQKSGSTNVIELHGSVHRNFCRKCGTFYDAEFIKNSKDIPLCKECGGQIKPDVVLYGESLNMNNIENSINYVERTNTLIVGGTSLAVYPASSIISYFRGSNIILINKTSTLYDKQFDLVINNSIGQVLDAVVKNI